MKKIFILFMTLVIFTNFTIAQTKEEKKQQKEELAQKEYEAIKKLIDSKMFVFNATWLTTQGGRHIDIRGNNNQVEVINDMTKATMQYFGVVTVSRFNSDGGVEFDSEIEDYNVKYVDKKQKIIISYTAKNKAEKYEVTMTVYKNRSAFVDLYSTYKNNITYQGTVAPIANGS